MILDGFPARAVLRDGSKVVIRPMSVSDGEAVLKFFRALPEEDRLFLNDDVTADDFMTRYLVLIDYKSTMPLVALASDGLVVGHAMLQRTLHGWMTHVGQVRMVVARSYQHKGLGTVLLRQLVRIAINSGLEKLVARIAENQTGAKKAFEHLHFKVEAVLRNHVKDIHGRKGNLILLANDVSHLWDSMEQLTRDFRPTGE